MYPFNKMDNKAKMDRRSSQGKYEICNGLPLNPNGRTGIKGRGLLGRWGVNHAVDPIVTRWKLDKSGKIDLNRFNKRIFEVILIKRLDNGEWSLPGVSTDELILSLVF